MKARSHRSGERGSLLITTIIILSFLAVLGMSLVTFLYSRISYSQIQLDRLKALYAAEAGVAKAFWELKHDVDPDANGQGNISKTRLAEGTFWAQHNFQTSVITATGEVNHVRRTVQIKYSAI